MCWQVAYQTALAAVCVEGILFIILAVTGLRLRLIRLVPKSIMLATSAGIGLFLAFIGLQSQEGLGIISYDVGTLVALGACPASSQASLLTRLSALTYHVPWRHRHETQEAKFGRAQAQCCSQK